MHQRLGANRLGAAERQPPTAQVERRPLFGAGAPHTVLVGKIRRTADDRVVIVNRLQPPHRPLQERRGRHQHPAAAHVHRRQDAADEAHVVIRGQPEHAGRRRDIFFQLADAERLADAFQVGQQVGVRNHHALRVARRARRVLQERQVVLVDRRPLPQIGQIIVQFIGRDPLVRRGVGRQQIGIKRRERLSGRQRHVGIAIDRDALQPRHRPLRLRIRRRHRDDARVHATEETPR